LASFLERFDENPSRGSQSYAVLTMCRGLYTLRDGEQLSKREAARRASIEFPGWAPEIDSALAWRDAARENDLDDGSSTVDRTRAFVSEIARLLDLSPE
jgi:hypothetical protein